MPDITKCHSILFAGDRVQCPLKSECYRYTVKPEKEFQPYFFIAAYDEVTNACKNFQTIPKQTNTPNHGETIPIDISDRGNVKTHRKLGKINRTT